MPKWHKPALIDATPANDEGYENLEGKHLHTLTLDTGSTTILLENPFWRAIEYLALEGGHANWRDWFHENILKGWDSDKPLTSHTRCTVATMLMEDL
jgi:predicted DNA-binding ribbon-helix-helix protein